MFASGETVVGSPILEGTIVSEGVVSEGTVVGETVVQGSPSDLAPVAESTTTSAGSVETIEPPVEAPEADAVEEK